MSCTAMVGLLGLALALSMLALAIGSLALALHNIVGVVDVSIIGVRSFDAGVISVGYRDVGVSVSVVGCLLYTSPSPRD